MFRILVVLITVFASSIYACEFDDVTFSASFESGKLDTCSQTNDGSYLLTFLPEDKPINPSPWYYFSVSSTSANTINVTLSFDGYSPRYLPKISTDNKSWQPIDFDTNDTGMTIQLNVSNKPLYVAAQPPVTNEVYENWLEYAKETFGITPFVLGKSLEGRNINAFAVTHDDNSEWIVFVGRQHPPEVTGAVAMFSFLESFLAQTKLNPDFTKRFNVLVVPNLNPDGVSNGHWRHSKGHKDLNRDWNVFSQPETRAVKTYLDGITALGDKIVMGMDFHSTHHNVFYTIPQEENIAPKSMVINWLSELQEQTKGVFKVVDKPGTSPGKGVFKQFFADVYNVHGVTYEVGDNEPNEKTRYVAKHAAKTLISTLINTPADAFYIKDCEQAPCEN